LKISDIPVRRMKGDAKGRKTGTDLGREIRRKGC
jgi:hypothetical protein